VTVKNANLVQSAHAHVFVRTTVILHKRREAEVVQRCFLLTLSQIASASKENVNHAINARIVINVSADRRRVVKRRKHERERVQLLLSTKKRRKLLQDEYNQRE